MGLEHLKSVFAEGVGNTAPQLGGRHNPGGQGHPSAHSLLDDVSPFLQIDSDASPLINLTTETNEQLSFPSNYSPINTIIAGEFTSEVGDSLKNHGWPDLYRSNHTSININQPSPRSNNPYQPFSYGNPNISSDLDIRNDNILSNFYSPSRGDEPYIVSDIGDDGRRLNRGNRLFPFERAKTDFKRVGRYLKSPAGLLQIALRNTHMIVNSNVVRDGDKLIKVPQRFNSGYSPISTLGAVGGRVLGQGVPNILLQSGHSRGYDVSSFFEGRGDEPKFKLNDTFTGATHDVKGEKLEDNDSGGFSNRVVEKVSTGDKMTLSKMIKGVELDNIGYTTATGVNDDENQLSFNINAKEEGMPFYFKDLRDNSYIFFRAFLEGVTEDIAPSWAEHTYIGRSEPVYVYERATRSLTFTLKLHAQTRPELTAIYKKMNRLTSLCYPEYAKDERLSNFLSIEEQNVTKIVTKNRMKPPLTKLRIGDMFGKTNNEIMGFIESLNYVIPEESTWETEVGARVPKYVMATITYKVLHGELPNLETQFYGYTGEKINGEI